VPGVIFRLGRGGLIFGHAIILKLEAMS
jgi:hypothetical protein